MASPASKLTLEEILKELRKAHIPVGRRTLNNVLEEFRGAPRVHARVAQPSAAGALAAAPAQLAVELALELHRLEVDSVEVVAPSVSPLRIDKVVDPQRPYWLSVWLTEVPPVSDEDSRPWMTLRDWRLPLVPLDQVKKLHGVLGVLQFGEIREAAETAEALIGGGTGQSAAGIRIQVEECAPPEASRRFNAGELIGRRRAAAARRLPESACLRCGLPLSDPVSVKIGIGPECRRYYEDDVIAALRRSRQGSKTLVGARVPAEWAILVMERFGAGFTESP